MPSNQNYELVSLIEEAEVCFLDEIYAIIKDRTSDPYFGVEQLAECMKLSRSQLSRKFIELDGVSPGKRIRQLKLHNASQRLSVSSDPVKKVAISCGFLSYNSFWRAFYQEFHCSPTNYRALRLQNKVRSGFIWSIEVLVDDNEEFRLFVHQRAWLHKLFALLINAVDKEAIALEVISKELYMSPSQVIRKLKAALAITPMKLQQQLRLLYAADQLMHSPYSIAQIAIRAGFFDQAHFCHAFKQLFGNSPSDYKKKGSKLDYLSVLHGLLI
ncbi:helix-turn-helix domain-containing protein [Reichenbachiella versicolor]|uniref:helix-turn-helix domain-containing protein n=1 Tax=Reichenbachiella versicolor TaxID=1821036 RepID=UPI0013A52CA3|nr:helix-turn-helix domain-containing protein [Reichenbachiella versicolor]